MASVEAELFRSRFENLDADEQLAFVAAVHEARGWDTELEDGVVVATRESDSRRIAVLQPPRFGTPELPDADTVLVTEANDTVTANAERAGLDYQTVGDLQDLLLYGLDRDTAEDVFQAHFGQPLAAIESDRGAEETTAQSTGFAPSFDLTVRQAGSVVGVLLVVAILLAGGGVFPWAQPPDSPPATNQTYTPGEAGAIGGERAYPPGLGPDGIENSGKLAVAHSRYLTNQSFTYDITAEGPQHVPVMLGLSFWNATVQFENSEHYRYRRHSIAPYGFSSEQRPTTTGQNVTVWVPIRNPSAYNDTEQESLIKEAYLNRTTMASRTEVQNEVQYRYASNASDNRTLPIVADRAFAVHFHLERYLWTNESSIRCTETTETDRCLLYRIEATGEPTELRGDVADYRAVAVVEPTGFVRELIVRYTIAQPENPEERGEVRFHLNYTSVGNQTVSVTPPEWLETAKNRSQEASTETPNE
jgi:hypothetical protein